MKVTRKKIYSLLSLIALVIFSLIPGVGYRTDNDFVETHYFFGYPAKWFSYYGNGSYNFQIYNLLLNFLVFYLSFILLDKLRKFFWKNQE